MSLKGEDPSVGAVCFVTAHGGGRKGSKARSAKQISKLNMIK